MRILLLVHGFNALSQRLFVELRALDHEVSVEIDVNDQTTLEAVALAAPDVIIAPYLKQAIPEAVFASTLTLVVHPGPVGDRGPSALDWAILESAESWGVTLLQATAVMDGGPVWAHRSFPMRHATKASLYRQEVTEAAVACVLEILPRLEAGERTAPPEIAGPAAQVTPIVRPSMPQAVRAIDWTTDGTGDVLRKLAASDGMPGVRATLKGRTVSLHDGQAAPALSGMPGTIVAKSGPALGLATRDGGVWIGRLRDRDSATPFKLPATQVLPVDGVPEIPVDAPGGYQEIRYREDGRVGVLSFAFLNGAMGTDATRRLLAAYREALARPTDVLVLEGGPDFWSNGMDLNRIEAAASPADASWENINALDDFAEAILRTDDRLTIAAIAGNAGAGGVFLARACDEVWLRRGAILNPHYKDMGNLYGSEFWTYSLPRHTTPEKAQAITEARLPMAAEEALALGLADAVIDGTPESFFQTAADRATRLADDDIAQRVAKKAALRITEEAGTPLSSYRDAELARMRVNFYGFDPSYHIARSNFVRKVPKARTPVTIARHRDQANTRPRRAS